MNTVLSILLIINILLGDGGDCFVPRNDGTTICDDGVVNPPLFQADAITAIAVSDKEAAVVHTAISLLKKDVKAVFGGELKSSSDSIAPDAVVIAGTIGINKYITRLVQKGLLDLSGIEGEWEAFHIQFVTDNNRPILVIVGSDPRGTAYGLLELSRLIGVSPWEWWADARPDKKGIFTLPKDYKISKSPSVQYRGIFLNDEDWGLLPWSTHTFEPDAKTKYPITGRFKGQIGSKTYAKIFELMLRLRANTIWPAMHEVTMPFYFVESNREMAEQYGIIVGTSHCEPMMRNSATEWDLAGEGAYNFFANKDRVISYWEDRLKELPDSENIFTIGMRGKHDGRMEGAKTTEQYKTALAEVIEAQTELLAHYCSESRKRPAGQAENDCAAKIPQQFVPYKEVLEVYNAGLQIPDYVTLVWPDDNHGYIRHYPDEQEQKRSGGNGVYYHISYWGAPHDYLWLGTMSPALICQQMTLAYQRGANRIWIVNVGDIKPSEYQTELFLDLAWNGGLYGKQVAEHLESWLKREFGEKIGAELLPVMQEHYRLAHIRRPEFLGNTRVYDGRTYEQVADLPFSENEILERLANYQHLSDKTEIIAKQIPENKQDEYLQLIKYPVQAAAQMNFKMLKAQLARHGKADWAESDAAFDSIVSLTKIYNSLGNGKWKGMMDFQPRKLPVFEAVKHDTIHYPLQYCNYTVLQPDNGVIIKRIEGLGCSGKAFLLPKNSAVTYSVSDSSDSIRIEIRLVPTHAIEGKTLRFSVSSDGNDSQTADYETKEFSEEWKQNILRNYAVRKFTLPGTSKKFKITALDEGVLIDEVLKIK